MTALQGNVVGLKMDTEKARSHINRIAYHLAQVDHHLTDARQLIWELKEYEGWRALGYASWGECVREEFTQHSSTIYRQINAALVELELSPMGEIGKVSERVLRPLTRRDFDASSRQLIWDISHEIVGEGGKVTTGVVEHLTEGLKDIMTTGYAQTPDGDQIALNDLSAADRADVIRADLTARVREVKLAHKQHKQDIQHLDAKRNYILGGLPIMCATCGGIGQPLAEIKLALENSLQKDKLVAALKRQTFTGKPIYISLWTED